MSNTQDMKVTVTVSTVYQMTEGEGRLKWFTLNAYSDYATFFNAVLKHIQDKWGEKSPSIRFVAVSTNIDHMGMITEHAIDKDLWQIMVLDNAS